MRKKSIVAWILGLLILVMGALGSLMMILALVAILAVPGIGEKMSAEISKGELLSLFLPVQVIFVVSFFFMGATALSGSGVMAAKMWGRNLLLVLSGVSLIWLAGDVLLAGKSFGMDVIVIGLIYLALLVYFSMPKQTELFE